MTSDSTLKDGANLRRIVAQINHGKIQAATIVGDYSGGLHLAVMTGPFLNLIVTGRKTVESRFHRQRRTPLFTAKPGDVVVFRQSGRPANVAAILGATHYLDIAEVGINTIRASWATRIGVDNDEFWADRADARWASLLELDSVFSIPLQSLHKRDRSAWVTYPSAEQSIEGLWSA
jgi:ASC-1-like (ASCH) protein